MAVANTDNDRWVPALNQDGTPAQPIHQDDGDDKVAMVCEVTDLVDLSSWPKGTRLIVRREPLHPGAQTSLLPVHDVSDLQPCLPAASGGDQGTIAPPPAVHPQSHDDRESCCGCPHGDRARELRPIPQAGGRTASARSGFIVSAPSQIVRSRIGHPGLLSERCVAEILAASLRLSTHLADAPCCASYPDDAEHGNAPRSLDIRERYFSDTPLTSSRRVVVWRAFLQ